MSRFYVTTEVRIARSSLSKPELRVVSNSVAIDTPLTMEEIKQAHLHITCQEDLEKLQAKAIELLKEKEK